MESDRNDPKWDAVIQQGTTDAECFGFNGTPSIVVQGPNGTEDDRRFDIPP